MRWPIGTADEDRVAIDRLPKGWFNATPFRVRYRIANKGDLTEHTGADLNCNTPHYNADFHSGVYAVEAGVVVKVEKRKGSWGYIIVIDHGDYRARYAHIENVLVNVGDVVIEGQRIASVGDANGYYQGNGAHLHFDISPTNILLMDTSDNRIGGAGYWPGLNDAKIAEHFVDPILFIIQRKGLSKPMEPQPTTPPNPATVPEKVQTMYVNTTNGDRLMLRAEPNTQARIISKHKAGTPVTVFNEMVISRDNVGFWKVKIGNAVGWMAAKYLTLTPP